MARDESPTQHLQEVAAKLSAVSRKNRYDRYELLEWPDSLAATDYRMAPELTTRYSTPVWGEFTEQQRLTLSRWESVNFFSLNVCGYRVELAEIETRRGPCPGVRQVTVVPARHRGLVDLALFSAASHLDRGDVTVALARLLPEYVVPRWAWRLDDLSLNANRKVDRPALADAAVWEVS